MNTALVFGFCVALSFGTLVSAQEESCLTGAQVFDTLLRHYDKRIAPPSLPITVDVEVWMQRFVEFDERLSELTFDFFLGNRWTDKRLDITKLKKTPVTCDENQALSREIVKQLWSPNLNFVQSRKMREHNSPNKNTFALMLKNGTVWINDRYELAIPCTQNSRGFPFTQLKCDAVYSSYSYSTKFVNLVWPTATAFMLLKNTSPIEYRFDKYELTRKLMQYPAGEFAELTLSMFFTRNWASYIFRVYLPAFSVTALVGLSFFFDSTSVASRSLLSMFAIAVLSHLFHAGSTTIGSCCTMLHLYLAICMAFAVASACELAVVSMLRKRSESVGSEKERRSDGFVPLNTNTSGHRNRTAVDMSAAGLFMLLFVIFHVAYVILVASVVSQ